MTVIDKNSFKFDNIKKRIDIHLENANNSIFNILGSTIVKISNPPRSSDNRQPMFTNITRLGFYDDNTGCFKFKKIIQ